jgi:hypothetical protein
MASKQGHNSSNWCSCNRTDDNITGYARDDSAKIDELQSEIAEVLRTFSDYLYTYINYGETWQGLLRFAILMTGLCSLLANMF